jgi:hypothetical protein
MNQPEPQASSLATLLAEIEKGLIKIPQFQRDFVWRKQKSAKLLDSILKGYPIGTFILWKTREPLRSVKEIGGATLPETPEGDFTQYVLDGQQRLTSLFASLKALKVNRDGILEDFSQMYVNLTTNEDEDIVIVDASDKEENTYLSIADLLAGGLTFLAAFPKEHHKRIEEYKKRLETYSFSTVVIKEAPIEVATEVFTRLNVGGVPLSVFEIMVAKTFDRDRDFDLAEQYEALIAKLKDVDYETISDATVLQVVSVLIRKECHKRDILRLKKNKFIDTWPAAIDAIERTVDYLRNYYRIPVSKLLPYNALIVPFAYYFYHAKDKPTGESRKRLMDFFWRTSLAGRYSSSLEAKLGQDIKRIDQILKGKEPEYDYPVDTSARFVEANGDFRTGRSFIKAILSLLAHHDPKSFIDNSVVRISNDWLKQANSKNYHHFFPSAFLQKLTSQGFQLPISNHIANITMVDDFLNKRKIRDKAPSVYMAEFTKQNDEIEATMKTHLINLDKDGVWDDDYRKFFEHRCENISKELGKRIIPREIDQLGQAINEDDLEEAELEE